VPDKEKRYYDRVKFNVVSFTARSINILSGSIPILLLEKVTRGLEAKNLPNIVERVEVLTAHLCAVVITIERNN